MDVYDRLRSLLSESLVERIAAVQELAAHPERRLIIKCMINKTQELTTDVDSYWQAVACHDASRLPAIMADHHYGYIEDVIKRLRRKYEKRFADSAHAAN